MELLLIGVLPQWQRKGGITALIFDEVMQKFIDNRIVYVESNPEQEKEHAGAAPVERLREQKTQRLAGLLPKTEMIATAELRTCRMTAGKACIK